MVNDEEAGIFTFWPSGGQQNWVWDRQDVHLKEGENKISVEVEGFVLFDHLNLIRK
jgi:hypothetical protein